MHKTVRIITVIMIAVVTLLAAALPMRAVASTLVWKEAGWVSSSSFTWLNAGTGLNLTTGEAGDDLLMEGPSVSARGGLVAVAALSSILTPPTSGYVTSLETAKLENKTVLVKLAGGGYAQVQFGMGWRSGSGYSGLQISKVLLSQEPEEPAPLPGPEPQPQPTPTPTPEPQPAPEQPAPGRLIIPTDPAGTPLVWANGGVDRWLGVGKGIDLTANADGTDLVLDGPTISAPAGLAILPDGSSLDGTRALPDVTFTTSVDARSAENKLLFVRLSGGGYAQVEIGPSLLGAGGFHTLRLMGWYVGVPLGKPEQQLTAPSQKETVAGPAGSLSILDHRLMYGFNQFEPVWAGRYIYIPTNESVFRFDPVTGKLTGTSARFALGLDGHPIESFWTGKQIFALVPDGQDGSYILRFDPATDEVRSMQPKLPYAVGAAGGYDGRYAYFFGLKDNGSSSYLSQYLIYRYDPETDTVTKMKARLPEISYSDNMEAVYDGTHFYIFGQSNGAILRYDPAADTIQKMNASPGQGATGMSAIWDGKQIYLFGGMRSYAPSAEISRYDPAADTLTPATGKLPTPRVGAAAVWTGTHVYLFGGQTDYFEGFTSQILRYFTGHTGSAVVAPRPGVDQGSSGGTQPQRVVRLQLDNPQAEVNGQQQMLDVPPQLLDGRTMVPLRFVAEALGAKLAWDGGEKRITLTSGSRTLILWVDQKRAVINGQTVSLDVAPTMLGGRTMVPLRFAAENLGADLKWNPADRSIVLTAGGSAPPTEQAEPGSSTATVPAMSCAFDGGQTGLIQSVPLQGITPDHLVVANDCTAWIYDNYQVKLFKVRLSDGQVLAEAKTTNDFIAALAYNPQNNRVYRISREPQIAVYDGSTGAAVDTITLPKTNWYDMPLILGATVDPQSGQLFVYSNSELWAVDKKDEVTGPIPISAGPGGIASSGAVVRGGTLWLLGQPWNGSPAIAIPVNTSTHDVGAPITLLDGSTMNFALGSVLEVHPTNGTFYLSAHDNAAGPFVAAVKDGQVLQKLFLSNFTATPYLTLSPDGEHLVLRDPGASGKAVTSRDYSYNSVSETYQLFSVFGSLLVARSADLSTVVESGTSLTEALPGWYLSDAGKPTGAVFSPDGSLLFISDKIGQKIHVYRLRP